MYCKTQIHFNRFFFFFKFIPTVAAAACANQDFSRTHKNIRSENKTTSIRWCGNGKESMMHWMWRTRNTRTLKQSSVLYRIDSRLLLNWLNRTNVFCRLFHYFYRYVCELNRNGTHWSNKLCKCQAANGWKMAQEFI